MRIIVGCPESVSRANIRYNIWTMVLLCEKTDFVGAQSELRGCLFFLLRYFISLFRCRKLNGINCKQAHEVIRPSCRGQSLQSATIMIITSVDIRLGLHFLYCVLETTHFPPGIRSLRLDEVSILHWLRLHPHLWKMKPMKFTL